MNYTYYILYSIVGAIILPLIYHLSLYNKYKLCALIPALPIIGLFGLFSIINNSGNIKGFIYNHIKFLACTISLYLVILLIYFFSKKIILSIILALLFWLSIICYNFA